MASVRKAVSQLSSELQVFSTELSQELNELKRNVEVKPVTGATLYRHCLEDLNDRLTSLGDDLGALEAISLDAISLEELVGHCAALYSANHRAITTLETKLRGYGYNDLYSPLPPENALDLMEILNHSSRKAKNQPGNAHGNDSDIDDLTADLIPTGRYNTTNSPDYSHIESSAMRQQQQQQPPSTLHRGRTALEAMAPMTAMKARMRDDTPSSLSSPELMSPSMRMLLGKYNASSSSGGSFNLSLPASAIRSNNVKGGAHTPRISLSPMPLSPAFQKAAEYQQQQMPSASAKPNTTTTNNAPTPQPPLSMLKLDGQKGQYAFDPQQRHFDEESTMELKAQVIFNRQAAEARERAKIAEREAQLAASAATASTAVGNGFSFKPAVSTGAATSELPTTLAMPNPAAIPSSTTTAATTPMVAAAGEHTTTATAATTTNGATTAGLTATGKATSADLSRAIAEALSNTGRTSTATNRSSISTVNTTSTTTSSRHSSDGVHQQQQAKPTNSAAFSSGSMLLPTTTGRESILSAMSLPNPATLSTSKAANPVPETVPEFRQVEEVDYCALPAFIRGQLSLDALIATEKAIHSMVSKRCDGSGSAGFTVDDLEVCLGTSGLPAGKGKVFVNALAKLGHLQVRVVYGQGTVYNFI